MRKYFEASGRAWALCATLVSALILLIVVVPVLSVGGEMLDVMGGYTHSADLAALEGYGEAGRRVYALASLTLDTLFPVVYASFLAGLIYRFRPTERMWRLAWRPPAAGVIDLGENVQIVLMLTRYPDISAGQVAGRLALHDAQGIRVLDRLGAGDLARGVRGGPRCSRMDSRPHVVTAAGGWAATNRGSRWWVGSDRRCDMGWCSSYLVGRRRNA